MKAAIVNFQRVKEIIERQAQMVAEYKAAWALFKQDKNFTPQELEYMYKTYSGMLAESVKSIDELFMVVDAFATQMSDAARLQIINEVADDVTERYGDLKKFNNQNKMISLQRSAEKGDIEYVKRLYGLSR